MVNELKPCPFCGSSATIERGGGHRVSALYSCDNCGCSLETGEEHNHGARWNTRADTSRLSELEAEVARLREALEVAEQAYQTGILFDEADLHGRAIVLRRAALRSQS